MEQNVPVSGQCSPTVQISEVEAVNIKTKVICTVLKELKRDCALQTYSHILNAAASAAGIPVCTKLYTNTVEIKFVVDGIKATVEISKDVINEIINNVVENISAIGVEDMTDRKFKEIVLQPIFAKMPWLNTLLKNRSQHKRRS